MRRLRILAAALAAAALTLFGVGFTATPHASAGSTYYVVESMVPNHAPAGCCSPGDSLHMLMWPPTPVAGVDAVTRCRNRGGTPWTQAFGNGYTYLWCLNIDF